MPTIASSFATISRSVTSVVSNNTCVNTVEALRDSFAHQPPAVRAAGATGLAAGLGGVAMYTSYAALPWAWGPAAFYVSPLLALDGSYRLYKTGSSEDTKALFAAALRASALKGASAGALFCAAAGHLGFVSLMASASVAAVGIVFEAVLGLAIHGIVADSAARHAATMRSADKNQRHQTDGTVESGIFVGDELQQGTRVLRCGDSDTGRFVDGRLQGEGVRILASGPQTGEVHSGTFERGQLIRGTVGYPDGGKDVGVVDNGKPSGHGKYTGADGARYLGAWEGGQKQGQGGQIYAHGRKYVGAWKSGSRHGQGQITFTSGDKYVGVWEADKPHGQGEYIRLPFGAKFFLDALDWISLTESSAIT